jgi:hypothetical protein
MGRTRTLLSTILALWLAVAAAAAPATAATGGAAAPTTGAAASPLEQRCAAWPTWRLPAPLPRPGRGDLLYPAWFAGDWQVSSWDAGASPESAVHWRVHFLPGPAGRVVGDRAANAAAVGRALLGDGLLSVRDDPANPNRQLAQLRGGQRLESTVLGRRSETSREGSTFLSDELSLQVLHGVGDPRVSRIETLSRYERQGEGLASWIAAEQWQARYGSPAEGLVAAPQASSHWRLRLDPLPPGSGPAN